MQGTGARPRAATTLLSAADAMQGGPSTHLMMWSQAGSTSQNSNREGVAGILAHNRTLLAWLLCLCVPTMIEGWGPDHHHAGCRQIDNRVAPMHMLRFKSPCAQQVLLLSVSVKDGAAYICVALLQQ